MNFQKEYFFSFTEILNHLIKISDENGEIKSNYQKTISLLKNSLKIPKEQPKSEEIYKFLILLKEPKKAKNIALKSFFLKTKVFLVWLISAYEFFSQKNLEIFVNSKIFLIIKFFLIIIK